PTYHALTRAFIHLSSFSYTAPPQIYTLSLHDALPICHCAAQLRRHDPEQLPYHGRERAGHQPPVRAQRGRQAPPRDPGQRSLLQDRKSTRLNSSHVKISYAVFCLKKKKHINTQNTMRG